MRATIMRGVSPSPTKPAASRHVEIAGFRDHLDRETLRETSPQSGDPRFNRLDILANEQRRNSGEKPMLFGIGASITFGGPKPPQFKLHALGDIGAALQLTTTIASIKNPSIAKLDPIRALNSAVEKKTGWTYDSNLDSRSHDERQRDAALERTGRVSSWRDAAVKSCGKDYSLKGETHGQTATRFVGSLIEPTLQEFKKSHPRVSNTTLDDLRGECIDYVLAQKPHSSRGLLDLFGLSRKGPKESTALDGDDLSLDTKNDLKTLLASRYKELVAHSRHESATNRSMRS